nr:molybdopterin-dependent oxidoreductase [Armatimonadota bacterium]
MPGLGASFGRGAATTYQQDLENSDCILIMGSNMAEAHPVGFRWPMKAKEKGAKIIHVDPRFTRTSALANLHVPIRAGSDIAFLGGIIHYILRNDRWFKPYVMHYTNATTIIDERFEDSEDLAGLFSGFDLKNHEYDPVTGHWNYEDKGAPSHEGEPDIAPNITSRQTPDDESKLKQEQTRTEYGLMGSGRGPHVAKPQPAKDPTLQHPRCVLNLLRRHFERYTPEMVAATCGCTPDQLVEVAELLCQNSGPERTGAIVYAVGWTQHTTGVQIIRAAGIIQLLLGNIGRPGGGIMAMRGHASIQGSTDIPTLYDMLPGYLPQPTIHRQNETLDEYVEEEGAKTGYWCNFRKFIVSFLKAYYGSAAQPDNDFQWKWIPRESSNCSQLVYFDRMSKGEVEGYFIFGQNPAGGGPNSGLHRAGLRELKWLVVLDWFETETAGFWNLDPKGPDPASVGTEVFFMPAAGVFEKEGCFTNTQRLLQWHEKAIDPPGDCRSDLWFVYNLGKRLKALYAGSTEAKDAPLLNLTWDYDFDTPPRLPDGTPSRISGEPDANKILREINGYDLTDIDPATGKCRQLKGFSSLKEDGSTACGCWIYSGVYPEEHRNRARSRVRGDNPVSPDWGWAWPHNR